MQVNAVSSNSVQYFGQNKRSNQTEVLEGFASLNDKQLQRLAIDKANEKFNDKKYRSTQNKIFYSIPIAGALASALASPIPVKVPDSALTNVKNTEQRIGKFVTDRARSIRFNRFINGAILGTAAFATFDLVLKGMHLAEKKNKTADEFAQKHPFLSTVTGLAVAGAALVGGAAGLTKLAVKAPKINTSALRKMVIGKNLLNNSKVLDKASELTAKTPAIVKSFTKGALNFAPWLLVLGSITNSINYSNGKTREIYKNYDQLKTAQIQVRETLKNANAAGNIDSGEA